MKVHLVLPRSFNDAQQIADKFKQGIPVILNLQSADTELSKRLIDFASGLTYALNGGMQRVADKVFLLTPRNVEVSAEQRAAAARARRLLQPGVGKRAIRREGGRHGARRTSTEVELFVNVFIGVYILAILAYILTSWVQLPYSLQPVQRFLYDVCEPYLRLWRRILPFSRRADRLLADGRRHRPDRARADRRSRSSTACTKEEEACGTHRLS